MVHRPDLYKALEGVAWELGRADSPALAALVDEMAGVIGAAQGPDGYVNSFVQAGLDVRWDDLVKSHELYCIGHLVQAGIAHRRATGSSSLFDVAVRAADCAVRDFGGGRRRDSDGHEEVEMALVELFRETGERAYLELARQFLDDRGYGLLGTDGHFEPAYFQDAVPVREQTEVVGHAVRAVYLIAGMVDVYVETGDQTLLDAAVAQWESMTARKAYVTGAVGLRVEGEAFGDPYELPPDLGYGETCASIGVVMASWRLLLATGEARFADAVERALHNLVAASTSVERTGFFYSNPAQRRVPHEPAPTDTRPTRAAAPGTRPPWFECACCPPNVLRTIASLGAYVATWSPAGVQVHQYVPATVAADLPEGRVELEVATAYPLDGVVDVRVVTSPDEPWELRLRVPAWAGDGARLEVDGEGRAAGGPGYAAVARRWEAGERVRLVLPVAPRLTVAHPSVDAVRGQVAVERGPVVLCFESPDQRGLDLERVELLVDRPLEEETVELLGQRVVRVRARGVQRDDSGWAGSGWATLGQEPAGAAREVELVAVPYALWANRGPSTMRVFVPARRG
ncbi:glycoside hydrolase family 127 protein [Motilibacter peucedani]|uniref:glycoside hydrolase family 127 protein n=1 Tax=Motilibacter peucedani TaxID=598650 RepID=UPI0015FF341D|nr:beta-L-arabinofuranosidase domain-containing protein [Motilibacter peucedani]